MFLNISYIFIYNNNLLFVMNGYHFLKMYFHFSSSIVTLSCVFLSKLIKTIKTQEMTKKSVKFQVSESLQ